MVIFINLLDFCAPKFTWSGCRQTNFEGRCAQKEEIDDVEMKILTGLKIF